MNKNIKFFLACTTLMGVFVTHEVKASETVKLNNTIEVAQMWQRGDDKGKYDKDNLAEKLNLTAQQRQEMSQIKAKYDPQMKTLREEMGAEREKLRTMMRNNESTENIRSQNQVIANLGNKMRALGFESMLEMREVLTPEQRDKFAELMQERRANMPEQRRNR
ncbi:MAG: Spy/CpxP family protein refolding chaperone [Cyanobacterium sp. T60_A2020_053]|nr:Spy/CpxP family protein refolding chaperone [Cyanobacterium sp. T60_A2020_053]